MLAERWRIHYNTVRPHSSLGYRPPAPAARQMEDKYGAWKSGKQRTLSTFPHPRLRRDSYYARCATLTLDWYKISGRPQSAAAEGREILVVAVVIC